MKLMTCPLNGPRNIAEFIYGGEYDASPNPRSCDSTEWAEHVFFDQNRAGVVIEWWCHAPSSYWFLAERNTISNHIIRTFSSSEVFQNRVDFGGDAE